MQLSQEQINQIVSLLNELPIKHTPIAQAISKVMQEAQDKESEKSAEPKKK
jgi:uncharacterized protein (UPF0147 family)